MRDGSPGKISSMPRASKNGRSADQVTRISHLELDNWRNFRHVDLDVEGRVFLVGPNAAGKSNLLDALRFLRDLVAVGGGFKAAVDRRGGVSDVRNLAARRYPEIGVRVVLGSDAAPGQWEYALQFRQDNRRQPEIAVERVLKGGEVLLERPDDSDRADPARLGQTALEQVNLNRNFRDVADFLRSIRYLHIVPQLVREPERSVGRTNDPYGGDFLEQVANTQEQTRRSRLRRIRDALQVAVPQLQELELEHDVRGTPHLRGKYEHWRPRGKWQSEADFSDGTLRLMGLLWATMDGVGPLLLEEPELSLHPEVVRHIPQMFGRLQVRRGRQVWVSSHSPALLEDEGIGLDEVFVLLPASEGTEVRSATDLEDVRRLLESGFSMADAVLPRTRPANVEQLEFFADRR